MKAIFIPFVLFICFFSCKSNSFDKGFTWQESQVLCVYWNSNFESRDTLPAINFIISYEKEKDLLGTDFYFRFVDSKGQIREFSLKEKRANSENLKRLGLILESKQLYKLFSEYNEDGNSSCYEKELTNYLGDGELFARSQERDYKIGKSSDFSFTIGLK